MTDGQNNNTTTTNKDEKTQQTTLGKSQEDDIVKGERKERERGDYIPNKQKPLDLHSEAPQAGTPTQRPQPDHTDQSRFPHSA